MRKMIVTCECGQRMQAPRSAMGKRGMCPSCGRTFTISPENTTVAPPRNHVLGAKPSWWKGRNDPPEDAKRRFGEAVDLYYGQRYAEALAIFNALAQEFPGNPDIENGRSRCMSALKKRPAIGQTLSLPNKGSFDKETVKRVVLDKMLNATQDDVQLEAAKLAAQILGLVDGQPLDKPEQAVATHDESPQTTGSDKQKPAQAGSHSQMDSAPAGGADDGKMRASDVDTDEAVPVEDEGRETEEANLGEETNAGGKHKSGKTAER